MSASVLRHRLHTVGGCDAYERDPLLKGSDDYVAFRDTTKRPLGAALQRERERERQREEQEQALERVKRTLAERAHEPFDVNRPAHLQALQALWSQAFGSDTPFERCGPTWGELGFQGRDPASDLRGAGYLGLQHLTAFLEATGPAYSDEVGANFPLALASLSCTAMLCRYFGLNRTLIFPGSDLHEARPDVVRSLLRLHAHGEGSHDALQTLHVRLVRHLAWVWSRMQGPETTIMAFGTALRATYTHLHRAILATPQPWRLITLTSMLERVEIDPWESDAGIPGVCASPLLSFLWMLAAHLMCGAPAGPGNLPAGQKKRE